MQWSFSNYQDPIGKVYGLWVFLKEWFFAGKHGTRPMSHVPSSCFKRYRPWNLKHPNLQQHGDKINKYLNCPKYHPVHSGNGETWEGIVALHHHFYCSNMVTWWKQNYLSWFKCPSRLKSMHISIVEPWLLVFRHYLSAGLIQSLVLNKSVLSVEFSSELSRQTNA